MRRNAFTWWQVVLILAGLALIAVILFPVFGRKRENARKSYCPSNLKKISLALAQYVQDYDEKYPLVNSGKQGWVDILQPYLKNKYLFQCPSEYAGDLIGTTDYYYNARLAGQEQSKLTFMSNTIMNGEGIGNSPTNYSLTKFPAGWATDSNSPAQRHLDGANYAFGDGQVKWFKPTRVSNEKANSSNYSFTPW